tara:strand:+ start:995 stop:1645 length:651 start_codon:yes stop_codon:yes gene_type:complete
MKKGTYHRQCVPYKTFKGTCPYCLREVGLKKDGTHVRHGWKTETHWEENVRGVQVWAGESQQGSCKGWNKRPLEQTDEDALEALTLLHEDASLWRAKLLAAIEHHRDNPKDWDAEYKAHALNQVAEIKGLCEGRETAHRSIHPALTSLIHKERPLADDEKRFLESAGVQLPDGELVICKRGWEPNPWIGQVIKVLSNGVFNTGVWLHHCDLFDGVP